MELILQISALAVLFLVCTAEFSRDFTDFLDRKYGQTMRNQLERVDEGRAYVGSFGGKMSENETIRNRPVIFVHGTTLRAGIFVQHRNYFMRNGYGSGELYATTYGDGGVEPFAMKKMDCKDVQSIREFILAVVDYTGSKVDIIAYSMGTAISRKAILGGNCVDTNEDLGPPITDLVDTFIAVGGVANGLENCWPWWPACNLVNGMICSSNYLKDVNSLNYRYEGTTSYALYSMTDPVIGQICCNKFCAELKYANMTFVRNGLDHGGIILGTIDLQYNLLHHIIPAEYGIGSL